MCVAKYFEQVEALKKDVDTSHIVLRPVLYVEFWSRRMQLKQ